jgi:16S rRNA (uracil1498-N3)-methyltransferase
VLRLRVGAPLALFNGRGGEYLARLVRADGAARVEIERHVPVERESPLRVTLAQALVASEKLDWVIEKATELGADTVLVYGAQRSVVRLDGERLRRRALHWRDIATAACCQCGRNRIPQVIALDALADVLSRVPDPDGPRYMLAPDAARDLAGDLPSSARRPGTGIAVLIGPEGGWDEAERAAARAAGWIAARLGPRVLRTETAGLAALAALQALAGDLAPRPGSHD